MTNFNFADEYKKGGIAPTAEIVTARSADFKSAYEMLDARKSCELVEIYFGVAESSPGWLVEAFRASDVAFTAVENEREILVLAGLLLAQSVADEDVVTCLAIVSGSVGGRRKPAISPGLVGEAGQMLSVISAFNRRGRKLSRSEITRVGASKFAELWKAYEEGQSDETLGKVLSGAHNEARASTNQLVDQIAPVFDRLISYSTQMREELDLLWWWTGGHSRLSGQAFLGHTHLEAGFLAGLDVADLTLKAPGPVAVPVLIANALERRKGKQGPTALAEAVTAMPVELLEKVTQGRTTAGLERLTPVLTALIRRQAWNAQDTWRAGYESVAALDLTTQLTPEEIANQIYGEALLIAQVGPLK